MRIDLLLPTLASLAVADPHRQQVDEFVDFVLDAAAELHLLLDRPRQGLFGCLVPFDFLQGEGGRLLKLTSNPGGCSDDQPTARPVEAVVAGILEVLEELAGAREVRRALLAGELEQVPAAAGVDHEEEVVLALLHHQLVALPVMPVGLFCFHQIIIMSRRSNHFRTLTRVRDSRLTPSKWLHLTRHSDGVSFTSV